jgi:hypothetical protein
MNVEIGTEASHFREKECIYGIFIAVCGTLLRWLTVQIFQLDYPTDFLNFKYQNPSSPGKMCYSSSFDSSILFYSVYVDPPL